MPFPGESSERRRKAIRLSLSVAVAALLIWLLLWGVDWKEAWEVMRRLSPAAWLVVFGVHASIYALRTLRFASLIPDRRVPFTHLWSIQAANQMASVLLPMRAGEVTYPIYLRNAGVPLEVGVAGLVVSRALDLLAVLTITVFSAIAIGTPIEKMPPGTGIPTVIGLTLVAAALIAVATGGAPFIRFIARVGTRLGLGIRVVARIEQVARGFETVGRYRSIAEAFALTLLIWLGVDLFYYLLMVDLGFGGELGPVDVAFGASAAILTNLLPINTFAGIGTQEWGWRSGFTLLDLKVSASALAASALAVHAVQLVNVGVLGLIAQFRLSPPPREEAEQVARRLARERERLRAAVSSVGAEDAATRPTPGRWSIAEVVDHLARTEESIVAKMRALLDQPGDVLAGRRVRIPLFIIRYRAPFFRFEAPSIVQPDASVTVAAALARLDASRAALLECLAREDDRALRGKRFRHFLLGALDLLEWSDFIRHHEARHRAQIAEIARAVRGRSARKIEPASVRSTAP